MDSLVPGLGCFKKDKSPPCSTRSGGTGRLEVVRLPCDDERRSSILISTRGSPVPSRTK